MNSIDKLKLIPMEYGTEIDIRAYGSELILNHEPFQSGENFNAYLDEYKNGTLVLNIKESGIESEVLKRVRMRPHIKNYFLLDVEFPYIYNASRNGERSIAVRYSEDESLQTVENYIGMVDWVWIDTNTRLPLNHNSIPILDQFKKCLVCPERWGRPENIGDYIVSLKDYGVNMNSVMTSLSYASKWKLSNQL